MAFINKTFGPEKIAQMNQQEERIQFVEYEIEHTKMKLENCATMEMSYQIEKRFCNYALKE